MSDTVSPGLPGSEPERRKIYSEPEDVDRRLGEMELTRDILLDAVGSGLLARLECTPNHPITAAGYGAWSQTVCRLRELLLPLGWVPSNAANQGLTVNERLVITLNVAGGDASTGVESLTPSTRSRHGASMASAVAANSGWLFEEEDPTLVELGRGSWLLLAYWDRAKRLVRLELSRPVKWGEDERPVGYSERILLPDIVYDGAPLPEIRPLFGDGPKTPEITVEIKRRA